MTIRRSPAEIAAIHRLEPTLRDIFVEGPNDAAIVQWFLRQARRTSVAVVAIEMIDVPDELIAAHGLRLGSRRSSVLALAYDLTDRGVASTTVLCIVDQDADRYTSVERSVPLLAYTDYNSFESYFMNEHVLGKFFGVVLRRPAFAPREVLDSMIPVLRTLFALRTAQQSLHWNIEWLQPKKYLSVDRGSIELDTQKFVTAYLGKGHRLHQLAEFMTAVQAVDAVLDPSPLLSTRGHDFTYVLFLWVARVCTPCPFRDCTALEGALSGCLEYSDLMSYPLFQRVASL